MADINFTIAGRCVRGKDDIMDGDAPLLKSLGYQRMIETMTPGDALLANNLLAPFLHDFTGADIKRVAVIVYLLGVKQGVHETECNFDSKCLEDQLLRVYEMGKQHGLHHMALLLGAEPMFSPKFFFGNKLGGSSS